MGRPGRAGRVPGGRLRQEGPAAPAPRQAPAGPQRGGAHPARLGALAGARSAGALRRRKPARGAAERPRGSFRVGTPRDGRAKVSAGGGPGRTRVAGAAGGSRGGGVRGDRRRANSPDVDLPGGAGQAVGALGSPRGSARGVAAAAVRPRRPGGALRGSPELGAGGRRGRIQRLPASRGRARLGRSPQPAAAREDGVRGSRRGVRVGLRVPCPDGRPRRTAGPGERSEPRGAGGAPRSVPPGDADRGSRRGRPGRHPPLLVPADRPGPGGIPRLSPHRRGGRAGASRRTAGGPAVPPGW